MNDVLQSYKQDLAIKGYSPKTQKTYFACVAKFLKGTDKPLSDLGKSDVKSHLYNIIKTGRCSSSTMNQTYSSLKYLFLQTLGRPWEMEGIPRVKKPKTLPRVLSTEEAFAIIKNAANEKHMVMLMLAYSAGLRVGELTRIKPANIIKDKMRVRIDNGKGNKDRYTILSGLCLAHLRSYWKKYRPAEWLFEGYTRGKPISERACQHAYDLAKLKAGIKREGGIHSLRHSFATHFLEAGGGIFQLQKFLGHKHIKTTLVYAHLQEEKTIARSPLDVYAHAGMFANR
jgi:site-specific recombinase XerD